MKKLFIIPGFGETTKDIGYKKISALAKKKGYEVIPVDLEWDYRVMTDWINTAKEKISVYEKDSELYILGFSFGAFAALDLSKEFNFKKILICSLSTPYYKENLKQLPDSAKKWLGQRRLHDFKKYSIPKKISTNTYFFQGENEWVVARKQMTKIATKRSLKIIKGAIHDINNDLYIKTVTNIL